ncbi:hypothetical protein ACFOWM_03435 [Ferruginibacter yonginensis]|uniref:Holin n=1 Tax=Ferruginibacter yonginensis TaxID=1310416 RepID=A0ABV8QNZ7_9BACT
MSKDTTLSLLRTLLMALGAYLIGKNLFGNVIDTSLWEQCIGYTLALITMVWSFVDKTSTLEGFQSTIRSTFVFVGGLLIAAGKLKDQSLDIILGLLNVFGPLIYSYLSRLKTKGLSNGTIKIDNLKGS